MHLKDEDKEETIMTDKIWYLCHPYSNNPIQSWKNAVTWTWQLRRKGYWVFSPILHTHPYHQILTKTQDFVPIPHQDENYGEDYVAWDLKLLQGFMTGDGSTQYYGICSNGHTVHAWNFYHLSCSWCEKLGNKYTMYPTEKSVNYDSGVGLLLDRSAYNEKWNSDGCRREYEFAKAHHLEVCDLQAFLDGRVEHV